MKIQLRTWQSATAAQALRKGGLRADGRRVDRDYRYPYRWLAGIMADRIPGFARRYPLWAYATGAPTARALCPGSNHCGARRVGHVCSHHLADVGDVELEVVLDDDLVILTDYDDWHFVLNGWYLPDRDEAARLDRQTPAIDAPADAWRGLDLRYDWERRAENALGTLYAGQHFGALPAALLRELEWSWTRCLVGADEIEGRRRAGLITQATLWEIRPEDVKRWRTVQETEGRLSIGAWNSGPLVRGDDRQGTSKEAT